MNVRMLKILALLLVSACLFYACGKKGPPFVPQQEFTPVIKDLQGELRNGNIKLAGAFKGVKKAEEIFDLVEACRVYYGKYSLSDPPCDGCPVNLQDFYEFKIVDVIDMDKFTCTIPDNEQQSIYYIEVRLVGKGEELGPLSNRIKIGT